MTEQKEETKKLVQRAHNILKAAYNSATNSGCRSRIEEMQVHVGYAEPGYGTLEGDDVVVTGSFNSYDGDNVPERVAEVLEKAGVEIEWNDEWAACNACYRLVRTQADSYSWTPSFYLEECEIFCEDCMEGDAESYLQSLENDHDKANTFSIRPEEYEYVCLGEFERGFHPGQDADPKRIADVLRDLNFERFLFNIDSVGQFDTRFSVWLHEEELEESELEMLELIALVDRSSDGPSVSGALKRGLEEASRKMAQLPDGGIKYAQINEDGTADVKSISVDDFIKGDLS